MLKFDRCAHSSDVVAVGGGGRTDAAIAGEMLGGFLARAGVAGMLVEGAVRDLEGINGVRLAALRRKRRLHHGLQWRTGRNQRPDSALGCVAVQHPGDVIRGDASGVVIVGGEHFDTVLDLARPVAERKTCDRRRLQAAPV